MGRPTSPSSSFTIRDGVKWSDGTPMTAEDVAYTFQLLQEQRGAELRRHPVRRRSPRPGNKVDLTFTRSQFVNQNKILDRLRDPEAQWSTIKDPSQDTAQEPDRHRPVQAEVVHPADHHAGAAATRTGRTCRRSRSCATPRTTTTTRRPPRWPTAPRSGASSSSRTTRPSSVDKDPKNHKLWFPAEPRHPRPVDQHHHEAVRQPGAAPGDGHGDQPRRHLHAGARPATSTRRSQSVTGIPTPAGESFIAAGVQGQEARGRRRGRQERPDRRPATSSRATS